MALKSGLAAQIGFADEVTPGLPVAPSVFLPLSTESLSQERERLESEGIRAGRRVLDPLQWNGGNHTVGGDVGLELYDVGTTKLLKHCFGGVATTGVGPYQHVFTPGDLSGKSFTTQVGRPDVGTGAVHPFTYDGCKVASWEIACQAGEIATFGVTVVGMREQAGSRVVTDGVTTDTESVITSASAAFTQADVGASVSGTGIPAGARILSVTNATTAVLSANATATDTGVSITIGLALGAVTYPANIRPFKFNHIGVTVGGSPVNVKGLTLSGDNGLNADRRFLNDEHIKEPLEADLRTYEGTLDVEFTDLGLYRRFLAGEEAAVVATAVRGASSLTITTNVRFDGETPGVSGREILEQTVPIKCVGSTDAAAITVTLTNADAAA
jgi:hypothetical protein